MGTLPLCGHATLQERDKGDIPVRLTKAPLANKLPSIADYTYRAEGILLAGYVG